MTGLFIGLAEELLCRGLVVQALRRAGRGEWSVMVLSSLIFAMLHATNLLSGQDLTTTAQQVAFTFGFGICMYLTLRVTGYLVYPILLHAAYDPSLFIATQGINKVAGTSGGQSTLAAITTLLYLAVAVVALVLVRGRVEPEPAPQAPPDVAR